jgi:Tfp pilus assembly protein PilF
MGYAANWLGQARLLRRGGKLAAAAQLCRKALDRDPLSFEALDLLAALCSEMGDHAEAARVLEVAAAGEPRSAERFRMLGAELCAAGQTDRAIQALTTAAEIDPGLASAWRDLGVLLHAVGRAAAGTEALRRVVEIEPESDAGWTNLGVALRNQGLLAEAETSYRRALDLNPRSAVAFRYAGILLSETGRYDESVDAFRSAIDLDPGDEGAHVGLTIALRLRGDYAQGWQEHESWVDSLTQGTGHGGLPKWQGDPMPGGVLDVHSDAGLGDAIQFVRYLPMVKERFEGRIRLVCQPQLLRLFRQVQGVDELVPAPEEDGAGRPPDRVISFHSLPWIFGTTVDSVPMPGGYLKADPDAVERWAAELASTPGLRVGLRWTGGLANPDLRRRSLPLADLAPLGAIGGVSLFSLQPEASGIEIERAPAGMKLRDFGDRIWEFGEMAALMSCLDLIITIDTVVAHIAGALSLPAWVLLPHVPDWRWLPSRPDDTPWYDSLRLFRQPSPGDWRSVVERVAARLRAEAAGVNPDCSRFL